MINFRRRGSIELPIDKIKTNPDQPRKNFNETELLELCSSIREFGVIQPVIVSKSDESTYFLIAGERRLRACVLLGLETIPAIIRDVGLKEASFIALVENIQRTDLDFIEEAEAYKHLVDDFGLTQGEIAERVGKRQSTISNKMRLLTLSDDIRELIKKNSLTERHARALLRLTDEKMRIQVVDRIATCGLNVLQSEKLIDDLLNKSNEETQVREKVKIINYRLYVNTIKKAFSFISDVEKSASFSEQDNGDFVEVRITIPKRSSVDKSIIDNFKKVNF